MTVGMFSNKSAMLRQQTLMREKKTNAEVTAEVERMQREKAEKRRKEAAYEVMLKKYLGMDWD